MSQLKPHAGFGSTTLSVRIMDHRLGRAIIVNLCHAHGRYPRFGSGLCHLGKRLTRKRDDKKFLNKCLNIHRRNQTFLLFNLKNVTLLIFIFPLQRRVASSRCVLLPVIQGVFSLTVKKCNFRHNCFFIV